MNVKNHVIKEHLLCSAVSLKCIRVNEVWRYSGAAPSLYLSDHCVSLFFFFFTFFFFGGMGRLVRKNMPSVSKKNAMMGHFSRLVLKWDERDGEKRCQRKTPKNRLSARCSPYRYESAHLFQLLRGKKMKNAVHMFTILTGRWIGQHCFWNEQTSTDARCKELQGF